MLLLAGAGAVGLRFLVLRKASLEADDGVKDMEPSPSLPVSIIIHTSKSIPIILSVRPTGKKSFDYLEITVNCQPVVHLTCQLHL